MRSPRELSWTTFLAVLLGYVLTACASGGQRTWRGPQGQICQETPTSPRAVDVSAVLRGSYAASTTASRPGTDTLLVSVSYDSAGVLSRVSAHARPGMSEGVEEIGERLRVRFAPTAEPRSHAYALYIPDGEPELRSYRVRTECEPILLNRREIARQLTFLADDLRGRETRVVTWLFVDAEGRVRNSVINRSSGDIGTDREMNRVSRQARFAPALQDGFAVPIWIALPLSIKAQPKFLRPGDCPPPEVQSIPCVQ